MAAEVDKEMKEKKYWQMSAEELAAATKQFAEPGVADQSRPLTRVFSKRMIRQQFRFDVRVAVDGSDLYVEAIQFFCRVRLEDQEPGEKRGHSDFLGGMAWFRSAGLLLAAACRRLGDDHTRAASGRRACFRGRRILGETF